MISNRFFEHPDHVWIIRIMIASVFVRAHLRPNPCHQSFYHLGRLQQSAGLPPFPRCPPTMFGSFPLNYLLQNVPAQFSNVAAHQPAQEPTLQSGLNPRQTQQARPGDWGGVELINLRATMGSCLQTRWPHRRREIVSAHASEPVSALPGSPVPASARFCALSLLLQRNLKVSHIPALGCPAVLYG